jgi:hypothetical protein
VTPHDPRTERRQDAEREQRAGRQQPGRRRTEPEVVPDILQERRQAAEQRPQIEPGQDDRDR